MTPALVDDGRHEQGEDDRRQRPTGGHPVDAASDRRQPAGAQLGDAAQHGGVDLIGEAAGPRRQQGDDQPGDEDARRRRSIRGPVRPIWRGSGGGAPDGRRRRRLIRTLEGTSRRNWLDRVAWQRRRLEWSRRRSRPPRGDDGCDVGIGRCRGGVELADGGGRQLGRRGIDHVDQRLSPPVDDLHPHERCDVLRRLQPAVVGQLDDVGGADQRIGREQQGDVDGAAEERLAGQRAPGVERRRTRRSAARRRRPDPPGRAAGSGTPPVRRTSARRRRRRGR